MRQMLRALGQQAIEQHLVETLRAAKRIGDALHRILVEIETGRAERQIEIGDRRRSSSAPPTASRPTLWQIVDEPTPPLAPMKAKTWPTGSVSGSL